jgi:LmbE family N-acetylglucosaminyl deacetylase
MKKSMYLGAHPDDIDVMIGHSIKSGIAVVATDGENGIDVTGSTLTPAELAVSRRQQSQNSLLLYGIPLHNQFYLELPDGNLWSHVPLIQQALGTLISTHDISRLVTTGADGYDGHPDHIAMYFAALGAAHTAALDGRNIEVWALNSSHEGERVIRGDSNRKLEAMACHTSQIRNPDDLTLWGGSKLYTPLIIGPETYDVTFVGRPTDMMYTPASG